MGGWGWGDEGNWILAACQGLLVALGHLTLIRMMYMIGTPNKILVAPTCVGGQEPQHAVRTTHGGCPIS